MAPGPTPPTVHCCTLRDNRTARIAARQVPLQRHGRHWTRETHFVPAASVQPRAPIGRFILSMRKRSAHPPALQVYNFATSEPGLGVPDVLLTVKSSPANVAMYCNPAWVTARSAHHGIAGPLNSVFQFGGRPHCSAHSWSAMASHVAPGSVECCVEPLLPPHLPFRSTTRVCRLALAQSCADCAAAGSYEQRVARKWGCEHGPGVEMWSGDCPPQSLQHPALYRSEAAQAVVQPAFPNRAPLVAPTAAAGFRWRGSAIPEPSGVGLSRGACVCVREGGWGFLC